jgi:hypothetical protein
MTDGQAAVQAEPQPDHHVVIGLVTAPGLPSELAQDLARGLPTLLEQRSPDVSWEFVVRTEPMAGATATDVDFVQLTRERMLDEGWQFAICLTDVPLRVGRRPVTAYASASLGVGVVSVPAFGAVKLGDRVRQAVLRVLDGLVSGSGAYTGPAHDENRRRFRIKIRLRELRELSSPVGRPDIADPDHGTVRFVTAAGPGNFRLLFGMVRANRPWRLIIGLSRALVAALGVGAFELTSQPIWQIADVMSWPRLLTLGLFSVAVICSTLIVGHGLWERPHSPVVRERVMLINAATTLTIVLGVLTLFVALLAITTLCDTALLLPRVLQAQLGHDPTFGDYLAVAWVVSSMATIGGALGAVLERDVTVREAAYGYRPTDDEDA